MNYRPWGQLSWLISRTEPSWSLLSCLSMEQRCVAAYNLMADIGCLSKAMVLDIENPSSRFAAKNNSLKEENKKTLKTGNFQVDFLSSTLLAGDGEIVQLIQTVIDSGVRNLICDITCMPKRFFFPCIKLLLRRPEIENFVVSYAVPASYHQGTLAEDHGPLKCLPLFGPNSFDDQVDIAIIGVGFVPLGLASLLEPYKDSTPVELLFPFPPGPPFYQRNWRFIQEIRHTLADRGSDPHRIHALDVSAAFDHVSALCAQGGKRAAFAPYGPKPISLAMCIYSTLNECPVYYTQPKAYHPEYSTGISTVAGKPNINAYAIRLAGHNFYET